MLTPIKAIRAKCLNCTCYQPSEVRNCQNEDCSLHPYRMGHHPKLSGRGPSNPFKNKKPVAATAISQKE